MKTALIVGSGLAGMTSAWRLQQQGWQVKLLDAGDRAGGRVLSTERNGFLIDAGPTLITDNYTEYLKLVDELGLSHLLVDSSPMVGILKGRELHVIDTARPLAGFLSTALLTPLQKLQLAIKGLQLLKPLRGLNPYDLTSHVHYDTESMACYLDRAFGRELNESLLAAVARGVTLSTPEDASVIEFFAGAVAASGKMRNLKGGMEVLPRALAAKLDIRLRAPVESVRREGQGVVVAWRDGEALREERADACIITTRFRDAAALYPPLQAKGARLLAATQYTGLYSLQLMYARRPEKEPFIVLVPSASSAEIAALFLEHVKAPDRAPAGQSQLTVFFNLKSPIDFASWSDERLVKVARDFVEDVFPELRGHYRDSFLTRWHYAAHLGNVGYYQALDEFLRMHPADDPVQVAGDYMAVSGQESAVVAGVNAARRLLQQP